MKKEYSLDEYANMMRENKPYLMALEELVNDVNFGRVEVILNVRNKIVFKMEVINRKVWLKPEVGHMQQAEYESVVRTSTKV